MLPLPHQRAMGCTSSAPNILPPTPQANATDTEIEEEINFDSSKELQTVATIELPERDTVMNQVDVAMVASNNESSMKIESPLLDPKDYPKDEPALTEVNNKNENYNDAKDNTSVKSSEKITNMEDVVEKVVELYIADPCPTNSLHTEKTTENFATPSNDNRIANTTDFTTNKETEQEEIEEEELPSVVSPSQSQSSRATRWEALADIAAELPPSLTVDPLTGQIYALSK